MLRSLSLWDWIDLCGLLTVTVGCAGELWLLYKPILAGAERQKRLEKIFTLLVVLGLAIELVAMPNSMYEAHKEIEEMKGENLKLEARIQPRRVSFEQRGLMLSEILDAKLSEKCSVNISVSEVDIEARVFAQQIRDSLRICGFDNVTLDSEIAILAPEASPAFGLRLSADRGHAQSCNAIVKALMRAKIPIAATFTSAGTNTNSMVIYVGPKPFD